MLMQQQLLCNKKGDLINDGLAVMAGPLFIMEINN
jgi:hypothetical protein